MTSARLARATCARASSPSSPGTSARSSCSPSRSAPRPVRRTTPTSTRPTRWPPTSGSTARCCGGSRPAAELDWPEASAPRSSAPTTGWSATSPSCSASAPPACPRSTVLFTGIAGLLAGALSMGAGEYVSVSSQRELLRASQPDPESQAALPHLDVDANELALVYRARGMGPEEAERHAADVLATMRLDPDQPPPEMDEHEALGSPWGAAISSFLFFAGGALIPVLPYIFGADGLHRGRHRVRSRRTRAARHRRCRRTALRHLTAAARAPAARDRLRRRGGDLPARFALRGERSAVSSREPRLPITTVASSFGVVDDARHQPALRDEFGGAGRLTPAGFDQQMSARREPALRLRGDPHVKIESVSRHRRARRVVRAPVPPAA